MTPQHIASAEGQLEVVRELISHGATLDQADVRLGVVVH